MREALVAEVQRRRTELLEHAAARRQRTRTDADGERTEMTHVVAAKLAAAIGHLRAQQQRWRAERAATDDEARCADLAALAAVATHQLYAMHPRAAPLESHGLGGGA